MSAPRPQVAASALRVAISRSSARPAPFVCHSCRRDATRALHTSQSRLAEKPWHQRLTESLFGSKEDLDAKKVRAQKHEKRIAEIQASGGAEAVSVEVSGRSYEIAPFVDPATNPGYQRATKWDGLQKVGGPQWAAKQGDTQEAFIGFAPLRVEKLPERQWAALLHLTIIELFALRRAGRDFADISRPREQPAIDFLINDEAALQSHATDPAIITNPAAEARLLKNISTSEEQASQESLAGSLKRIREVVDGGKWKMPATSETWAAIALNEPAIKLAIHKRVFQLTGKRLPDVTLMRATNLEQLRQEYLTKPAPAKLAKDHQFVRIGRDMPNVRIMPKLRTWRNKEQEVGRWKVIQEEWHRRGLPLRGTNYPTGNARPPL